MDEEYEFLLVAYQDYINELEEWPNFRSVREIEKYAGNSSKPMPLLIRECGRLIPVLDPKSNYVNFHPFNMPTTIIENINIIGTIVGLKHSSRYIQMSVNDGTGIIAVFYKMKNYENELKRREAIDREYEISAEDLPSLMRLMKKTVIDDDPRKQLQEGKRAWWDACRHGMLGKPLDIGSYVSVYGYCNVKRSDFHCTNEGNNFWASGHMPLIVVNAYEIMSISEREYNDKLEERVNDIVKKKYTADENSIVTDL